MLKPHELDPTLDAVVAAPEFHRVLLENEHVRVLEVAIEPGAREPFHTHIWQSLFVVMGTPHLRYFIPEFEKHLFEIPPQRETGILHLAPEGLHSLENIDSRRLYAFRIEMKSAPDVPEREGAKGPILEVGTPSERLFLDNSVVMVCSMNNLHQSDLLSPVIVLISPFGPTPAIWSTAPEERLKRPMSDVVVSLKYL